MITEDPDNKKKVTSESPKPAPQEAGVLREQLRQMKFARRRLEERLDANGTTHVLDSVEKIDISNELVDQIISLFSTAVDGMIPAVPEQPQGTTDDIIDRVPRYAMANDFRAQGFATAIAEMQRRRKEAGL